MPTAYKVLGQSAPAATTNTDAYTVPAATQTVVSTITVCNRAATGGTYRIAVRSNFCCRHVSNWQIIFIKQNASQ